MTFVLLLNPESIKLIALQMVGETEIPLHKIKSRQINYWLGDIRLWNYDKRSAPWLKNVTRRPQLVDCGEVISILALYIPGRVEGNSTKQIIVFVSYI